MNAKETKLPGVLILEPDVFSDDKGFFLETWNSRRYGKDGIKCSFVQDNVSFSKKGVLRGLHFQFPQSQVKLVQVFSGEVVDVAVDVGVGVVAKGCDRFERWRMVPPSVMANRLVGEATHTSISNSLASLLVWLQPDSACTEAGKNIDAVRIDKETIRVAPAIAINRRFSLKYIPLSLFSATLSVQCRLLNVSSTWLPILSVSACLLFI